MSTDPETPLARYLRRHKMTQAAFAAILTAARGWPVDRSHVCRWALGYHVPMTGTLMAIERATGGEVTVAQYRRWAQSYA